MGQGLCITCVLNGRYLFVLGTNIVTTMINGGICPETWPQNLSYCRFRDCNILSIGIREFVLPIPKRKLFYLAYRCIFLLSYFVFHPYKPCLIIEIHNRHSFNNLCSFLTKVRWDNISQEKVYNKSVKYDCSSQICVTHSYQAV